MLRNIPCWVALAMLAGQAQEPAIPRSDGASAGDTAKVVRPAPEDSAMADPVELKAMTVIRKSRASQLEDGAFPVSVVETRKQAHRTKTPLELLNHETGITVRRNGGMGSQADVSVHGLSGRRVRFFVDGIPADFLGMGAGMPNVPVNLLDRVEIYKGAVPIELGGDALGGAINLVTRKDAGSYFDFSYDYGSFDSHVTSLQTRMTLPADHFLEARAFQNLSDNDYPVDVRLINPVTSNLDDHTTRVRRFHDGFSDGGVRALAGRRGPRGGEYGAIGIERYGMTKEIQHNLNMEQPYGEVVLRERTDGAFFDFTNSTWLERLDLRLHGSLRRTGSEYEDTSRNTYAWTGEVFSVRKGPGGEVGFDRGNHIGLETDVALGNAGLAWRIGNGWKMGVNDLVIHRERTGKDFLAVPGRSEDQMVKPNSLFRNEAGVALEGAFGRGIETITTAKMHTGRAKGYNGNAEMDISQDVFGFGQAFRMDLGEDLSVKTSYERTSRLPDENEFFGYLRVTAPNLFLRPEKGHNLNLGLRWKHGPISAEMGGFYRFVDDFIYLWPGSNRLQYRNLLKSRFAGIEGEIHWGPFNWLNLDLNGTYQDVRSLTSNHKDGNAGESFYGERLPNLPYLFGNAAVALSPKGVLLPQDRLRLFWTTRYTHWFYLQWESQGRKDKKYTIPSQLIQDAGLTYSLFANRVNLTAEALNLADIKVYDHFGIQRPGRSLHAKISVFFDRGPALP